MQGTSSVSPDQLTRNRWQPNWVALGYLMAAAALLFGWWLRDQNITRAADGLGYVMGIAGGVLMVLLLIYPLRKRLRSLQSLGSVKFWFRTHMIFGVAGPVLVVLHSNFSLGSINSTVAMVCTLIVAGSGIIGRYLYAKIHHGMHGHRISLDEMRIKGAPLQHSALAELFAGMTERFEAAEADVRSASAGLGSSFIVALRAPFTARKLKTELVRHLETTLDRLADDCATIAGQRQRLLSSAVSYLDRRLATLQKFSKLSAFERLFGLWHVVHFPLFVVMVLAAIVHVIAVHAY